MPHRWHYVLPDATLSAALLTHNLSPQDSLGGESPHDLVYGYHSASDASDLLPVSPPANDTTSILRHCDRILSELPTLQSREPWMLEEDDCSAVQADHDWHQATRIFFARSPVTPPLLADFLHAYSHLPVVQFDAAAAYFPEPPSVDFSSLKPACLSSKVAHPSHLSHEGTHLQVWHIFA